MAVAGLGLALALGMAACSVARRGQEALTPLLQPPPAAPRPLEHPAVEGVVQRMLEARRQDERLHTGRAPEHRRLLSPLCAPGTEWEASSLSWAVLRQTGALLPMAWPDIPRSPEALQGWLRQEQALARQISTELWLIQTRPGAPAEGQLLIVRGDHVWRSDGEAVAVAAAERRSWVLTATETPPIARSVEGDWRGAGPLAYLRERGGRVGLEWRSGLHEVERKGSDLRLDQRDGAMHPWEEWNRSWLERHEERLRAPQPTAALLSGDARLELHMSEPAPLTAQRWQWVMARERMSAALPLEHASDARVTGIVAAPRAWGDHDAWLVLENSGPESAITIALYSAPLRTLPQVPMWDSLVDTPAIAQTIPASPITVAPVSPAGLRGAALEDPWVAWRLAHCGVRLCASWAPWTTREVFPWTRAASEGGRIWELRLPQLKAWGDRPAVNASDWARALRAITAEARAVEGRGPQDDWLLGPLVGAKIEATREGVRLTFRQPVPDLPDRLTHPRLALQDSVVASRFASHRFASRQNLDLLVPRHAGLTPLRLVPTRDPAQARVRFVRGDDALLRPFELALDDPLARAAAAAAAKASGGVAQTPDGNALPEQPVCVAMVLDAEAPPALRHALAHRLRTFTPRELLAVEDSTLRPTFPGSPLAPGQLALAAPTIPATPGALRTVVLELSVDVLPEAQRAAERIAVLLQADGVRTELVPGTSAASSVGVPGQQRSGAGDTPRRVHARLTRIPLFAAESLLRALELRSRVLPGRELPEHLRAAARLDPETGLPRVEAAAQVYSALLEEALLVPLWTQPGVVLFDRRLGDAGPLSRSEHELTSLPLTLNEARWYRLPPAR